MYEIDRQRSYDIKVTRTCTLGWLVDFRAPSGGGMKRLTARVWVVGVQVESVLVLPGAVATSARPTGPRPSFLLALMFGVLATAERFFSRADWTIAHIEPNADGLTAPGRPVYTMQPPGVAFQVVLYVLFCLVRVELRG